MLPKLLKKNKIILINFLLCGCVTQAPPALACHQFSANDKAEIREAIGNLDPLSPIHPVIRDYARVCLQLK